MVAIGVRGLVEATPEEVGMSSERLANVPWLRNLHQRAAERVDIADADSGLVQPVEAEVLAECAVRQIGRVEFIAPGGVVAGGVAEHSLVRAAVVFGVGLAVAVEVGCAQHERSGDGLLEEAGAPGVALWVGRFVGTDLARTGDVERDEHVT